VSWEVVARDHELMARSTDHDFWRQFLTDRPDVMYRLLGDLHQAAAVIKGEDPTRVPTVEELGKLVSAQYTNEPFGDALKCLLNGRSVRWLAQQLRLHHSQITRIIRGERDIVTLRDPAGSMYQIEAIARVLRVHPSYFVEWRRLWIMALLDDAFAAQPHLSIGVWKRFSVHEPGR
jgi:hypothetical protein